MATLSLLALLALSTNAPTVWKAENHSQTVTACDILLAHPDDPGRVAPGVSRKDADLAKAITACEKAVASDPENPRLNYQMARAYGYSGMGEKALTYREKAVQAGYPQALFVVGYITMLGLNKQPKNHCEGAGLIRESAKAGRLAGQVSFPNLYLQGRLTSCNFQVSKEELTGYLRHAKQTAGDDFYRNMLVDRLLDDVQKIEDKKD